MQLSEAGSLTKNILIETRMQSAVRHQTQKDVPLQKDLLVETRVYLRLSTSCVYRNIEFVKKRQTGGAE